MRSPLFEYLKTHRKGAGADGYVFISNSGAQRTKDRYSELSARSSARANELLDARGQKLIDHRVTSHTFRSTYVTALAELGENPAEIMPRLGHTPSSPNQRGL